MTDLLFCIFCGKLLLKRLLIYMCLHVSVFYFLCRWSFLFSELSMWWKVQCFKGWSRRSYADFLWYMFTSYRTPSLSLRLFTKWNSLVFSDTWRRGHSTLVRSSKCIKLIKKKDFFFLSALFLQRKDKTVKQRPPGLREN